MAFDDLGSLLEEDFGSEKTIELKDKAIVLVIDDDPTMRDDIEYALQDDYSVQLYGTAKEGVAAINSNVNVVILDIRMPDQDGFKTFQQIKERNFHIPIIFHSAYQDVKDPYDVMNEYRPFGYVVKGTSLSKLLNSVASAVEYERKLSTTY
jgi:two-component system response regulator DctR